MKKLLFLTSAIVSFAVSAMTSAAGLYPEVPCSQYGLPSTDQCFNAGHLYAAGNVGAVNLYDEIYNKGGQPFVMFQRDPFGDEGFRYRAEKLQNSTTWYLTPNPFQWAESLNANNEWKYITVNGAKHNFITLNPGDNKRFVEFKNGASLRLLNVDYGADRNQPAFKITYTTKVFPFVNNVIDSKNPSIHHEHTFYYPAWCGDGVVDSQYGEVYDDGVNNGKPGYASTDCKTKNTPPTNGVCDGASNGVPTYTAPTTNLCKTGTPSVVREENGKFVWTCNGVNGGSNATCEAPKKQDAYCGTADGQIFSTAPTTNLCAVGTATPVTGNNPYTWTCQGVNGGKDMTCATKPPQTPQPPQPPAVCDQVFTGKLRVGYSYGFPDYYSNNNSFPHTLRSFSVDFRENYGDDMNRDGKNTFENFRWVPPYGPGVQIPARAQRVKIIEASPRYQLTHAPARRLKDNIYIEYTINGTGNGDFSHKECISYEVTWCGDGILDRDEGEVCDPNDPNKTGWGPGGCNAQCQPIQQETPKDLDLAIKKYLGGNNDAQPGSPAKLKTGNVFDYVLHVRVASGKATGTTTVKDVLPAGVESTGNPYGNGWNCSLQGKSLTCTTNAEVSTGNYFPEILVPVRVTATEGTVRNDATVHNPNEKPNSCYTDNRMPSGSEQSCERDPKNTDPAVFVVDKPQEKKPLLQIKKYAKGSDAQTASGAVRIAPGEAYDYTFEVRNIGTGDAKGAKVVDVLPDTLEVLGTATGTDWSCTQSGQTMTCRYSKVIRAGAKAPTITLRVRMRDSVQSGQVIRNVAGVCELDPTLPIDDPSCVINRDECKPGDVNYNPVTNTCDPSTVVKDDDGSLDLSLKKYIDANDAQPGSPVSKSAGNTFHYIIKVKVESGTATGTTTVRDVLPTGVEMAGTAQGNGWTVKYHTGSRLIEATSTQVVRRGNFFSDITIPVKVTAGDNATVRNDATVHNPNEKPNSCYTDNRMPSGSEQSCERDPKNTDPAVFRTSWPGGPPQSNWGTVMCVHDIAITKTYGSWQACDTDRLSVTDVNKRSNQCMELDGQGTNAPWFKTEKERIQPYCSRTSTPPPLPPYSPYCGDGIVNRIGEVCDPGTGRGANVNQARAGNNACNANCTHNEATITKPGENPIKYMIRIPGFAKLGGTAYNKEFRENGMIVGANTHLFSLSDEVYLEMNPKFRAPIQLESHRLFKMYTHGGHATGSSAEVRATNVDHLPYWRHEDGTTYYVLGSGEFLIPKKADKTMPVYSGIHCDNSANTGSIYVLCTSDAMNSVKIFSWRHLQDIKGQSEGMGKVAIGIKQLTGHDFTDLASFDVSVVSGKVSSLSSPVNRKIKQFTTDFKSNVTGFLTGLKGNTSLVTNTDNNAGSFPFGTNTINPINANIRSTGNVTVNSASDLTKYIHNGNQNVYAVKGELTIDGEGIEMTGVKTVLVEGNIHIKKNIFYKSGDNNASWAFIAKGGNIIVDKNVTSLAGVFLAIPENGKGGKFTQTEATATILRIDGTLYGDAKELFEKRTYARASNAYDILTTGTVLNYSNRALRNPPPLLSNYLNNYKVQRVVR